MRRWTMVSSVLLAGGCIGPTITELTAGGGSGDGSATSDASPTSGAAGGDTSDGGPPSVTSSAGDTTGDGPSKTTDPTDPVDPTAPPHFDIGGVPDAPPGNGSGTLSALLIADGTVMLAYGSENGIVDYFEPVGGPPEGDQCGLEYQPETIPGWAEYVYLIAYSDNVDTQGLLGMVVRESPYHGPPPLWDPDPIYTGDPAWEVCATGEDYDLTDEPPPLDFIDFNIEQCNLRTLDPNFTSQGWVDQVGTAAGAVAAGEFNDTPLDGTPQAGNEFPIRCADWLPPEAQWMWFNWDPENITWPAQSPFIHPGSLGNITKEFLIFRLHHEDVPT